MSAITFKLSKMCNHLKQNSFAVHSLKTSWFDTSLIYDVLYWHFCFLQNPNDISYVFSGYAPLSVRLAQILHRPGWRSITEVLSLLPGPTVDEAQPIPVGLRKRRELMTYLLSSSYDAVIMQLYIELNLMTNYQLPGFYLAPVVCMYSRPCFEVILPLITSDLMWEKRLCYVRYNRRGATEPIQKLGGDTKVVRK